MQNFLYSLAKQTVCNEQAIKGLSKGLSRTNALFNMFGLTVIVYEIMNELDKRELKRKIKNIEDSTEM